jgi:hypothetical protein
MLLLQMNKLRLSKHIADWIEVGVLGSVLGLGGGGQGLPCVGGRSVCLEAWKQVSMCEHVCKVFQARPAMGKGQKIVVHTGHLPLSLGSQPELLQYQNQPHSVTLLSRGLPGGLGWESGGITQGPAFAFCLYNSIHPAPNC